MSKVTTTANQEPKVDLNLQALAELWEREEKWWLECDNHEVQWCFENRVVITALQSSEEETSIFQLECIGCQRWYKHCMFSNRERKSGYPICRWCQAEKGLGTDPQQFEIGRHIHCNRSGKKTCGEGNMSLEVPASRRQVKEAGIDDIAPPEVQFVVKKKMTQKERKAAQRAAALEEAGVEESRTW